MHDQRESNQNLGNRLGPRPCVRLTDKYRLYESGNQVKDLLGNSSLTWDDHTYNKRRPVQQVSIPQTLLPKLPPQKEGWETSSRAYGRGANPNN